MNLSKATPLTLPLGFIAAVIVGVWSIGAKYESYKREVHRVNEKHDQLSTRSSKLEARVNELDKTSRDNSINIRILEERFQQIQKNNQRILEMQEEILKKL